MRDPRSHLDHIGRAIDSGQRCRRNWQRYERAELFSYGYFGLCRACRLYSPAKGASFDTYARTCINSAIRDGLRDMAGGRTQVNGRRCQRPPARRLPRQLAAKPQPRQGHIEEILRNASPGLAPRAALAFRLCLIAGLDQSEVARSLGYSQPQISLDCKAARAHFSRTLDVAAL